MRLGIPSTPFSSQQQGLQGDDLRSVLSGKARAEGLHVTPALSSHLLASGWFAPEYRSPACRGGFHHKQRALNGTNKSPQAVRGMEC